MEMRNGIILGYLITYRLENKIGGDCQLDTLRTTSYFNLLLSRTGSDIILSKKTADTELTLENLETFTSYYIKVAAFTKVGSGVRSEKMICTTSQDGENTDSFSRGILFAGLYKSRSLLLAVRTKLTCLLVHI